ncbi:MAG: DUF2064 domain-containing protein [Nitrospirae bacterium]|nr:DUF2064 domain-containing protein [Nitrospirota bacterium]
MRLDQPQPLLLVFTLGPHREQLRRGLLPRRLQGAERLFHQRSLDSVLAAGRSSGCDCRVASPDPLDLPFGPKRVEQTGRSFGERLQSSIQSIEKESSGRSVIVVGTDSPELSEDHLQETLSLLANDPDRVVIGPASDGGFYLLAFNRSLDTELSRVPWCRGDTLECLLAALEHSGRPVTLLAALEDLDHRTDLERWLAKRVLVRSACHELHCWLRRLLSDLRRPRSLAVIGIPIPVSTHPLRGRSPPA